MRKVILSLTELSKSFGVIKALDHVSFDVHAGEVLGLLGANGAGKSTLLKIIGGTLMADEGTMVLDDQPYCPPRAFVAKSEGVISVYQELNVFHNMTVAENLFLGNEQKNLLGFIDWNATYEKATQLLSDMDLESIPSRELVGNLSIANQQIVEIARAINEKPKILLLDEPTASLSEIQTQWLFEKIGELTHHNTTIIYVSHRLEEVMELCDRVIVLRDGQFAAEIEKEKLERDTIVRHMVGQELTKDVIKRPNVIGEVVMECENLALTGTFENITFNVKKGEVLGIAGLVGAGRSELLNCIYGITPLDQGEIKINGKTVHIAHPKDALKAGIALVSEDRKAEGLFMPEPTRINLAANTLRRRSRLGVIDGKTERSETLSIADGVHFDTRRIETPAHQLSGGNQQKIFIGKNLLTNSDVLLLDEPTRGVDVGARDEIYSLIEQLSLDGKAVVLVSSDWEELTSFADRVIVMSEGRFVCELEGQAICEESMLHHCTEFKCEKIEHTEPSLRSKFSAYAKQNRHTSFLGLAFLVLFITGSLVTPFFLNRNNLNNLISQSMVYLFLTIGQMIVIMGGGIDLSLSANLAVSSIICVKLMLAFPGQLVFAMSIMLLVGLFIGFINGLIIVYLKVDPFITTLAVQMILQGVALILTPKPLSPAPQVLKQFANSTWLTLPLVLYAALIVFVVMHVILKYFPFGRHLHAVGENAVGASWLGLRERRIRLLSYVAAALLAVIAGFYLLGRNGAAEPVVDTGMALYSIAYALIGGATLAGGKGSLAGSTLAVLVITVLLNILNHLGVRNNIQEIIRGVVVMVILISYSGGYFKKRKKKGRR